MFKIVNIQSRVKHYSFGIIWPESIFQFPDKVIGWREVREIDHIFCLISFQYRRGIVDNYV